MKYFPHAIALLLLLTFAGVVAATTQTTKLPPLPAAIPTPGGLMPVKIVHFLTCDINNDGKPLAAFGCFSGDERSLEIADSAKAPNGASVAVPLIRQWTSLEHEKVHMILYFANIHFQNPRGEEILADAVANARVLEMLAR